MKKYNFSRKHWLVIAICFVLFLLANAVTADSENVILPKLAEANGWDYSFVLTLATVAGCSSVVGSLLLGKLCEKMGGKFAILFGLVASAAFVFLYGTSKFYLIFVIGLFGTICCGQSVSFFGANSLVANWFPKKKGLAMGIISIGPPVATIFMVSVLNAIIGKAGITGGIFTLCGVCLVVAAICAVLVHNTPEEVGETPDNLPVDSTKSADEELKPTMTAGDLVKNKSFWAVAAICGICSLSQTGLMAQWLVRYTSNGYSETKAALMMSICAVAGIFGSMIAGNIENRLGTKKGYVVLAVWFMVSFMLNFTNITPLVYLSVPMFGLSITLYQIFMPAFEISVFGRENFKVVNGILFPIVSMSGQLTFLVIALCMNLFGEVRFAYIVFTVLLGITIALSLSLKEEKNG